MYENILSNMLGCQTYCISDSPSNRYCFIGPIEGPALRAARPSRGTWSSPVASRAPATSTSETWFGR